MGNSHKKNETSPLMRGRLIRIQTLDLRRYKSVASKIEILMTSESPEGHSNFPAAHLNRAHLEIKRQDITKLMFFHNKTHNSNI